MMIQPKRIDGRARTVRELLDGARYTIDFYQREYAWQARQVQELVDDLTGKFLDSYEEAHERHEVARYAHYFLGSVVMCHKRDQKFIVDGQQRLTTLTLLLIHLHHLQGGREDGVPVERLIFSSKYGERKFNLDVDQRAACMEHLLRGEDFDTDDANESVQNIVARYNDIREHFPEELIGQALPFFVDWLQENVHFVEIEAYSDEDAYTIFETMNDRGLSLSLPEMLKGYVLANILKEDAQRRVNDLWKRRMHDLKDVDKEEDVDFFKNWFRGRYADTIRHGKGSENRDYERIGSEFHRWVRDRKSELGLNGTDSFVAFVERDLDFYAKQTLRIRQAGRTFTTGLESIYFNEHRSLTTQSQVLLAALNPKDSKADIDLKLRLVADYLDIWLTRQAWNYRSTAQRLVKYKLFTLTKDVRDKSVEELSEYLQARLTEDGDTFGKNPTLRAHQQNFYGVRHILARLSYWVDNQCGVASHFEDYVNHGRGRPFEVEHIWENHPERFREWFDHPNDFDQARNRIGGLLLLQRGYNQSLSDKPYVDKRDAYLAHGASLLTKSLHPDAYKNNPAFAALIERTGLQFRHVDRFDPEAQKERQELYLRIAEWVWNPSRLDLDGETPPIPEPLEEPDDDEPSEPVERGHRHKRRLAFWTALRDHAREVGALHASSKPGGYHWHGRRIDGFWWNYVVRQEDTRVEVYIDLAQRECNKAIFDHIASYQDEIESAFGAPLNWQRLDDKRASRITTTFPGGWANESAWPVVIPKVVDAMERFHKVLHKRAFEARNDQQDEAGGMLVGVDRAFWVENAAEEIVEIADEVLAIINETADPKQQLNYNRHYIGLSDGTKSRNFVYFKPRRKAVRVVVPGGWTEERASKFNEAGLSADKRENGKLSLKLHPGDIEQHRELLAEVIGEVVRQEQG